MDIFPIKSNQEKIKGKNHPIHITKIILSMMRKLMHISVQKIKYCHSKENIDIKRNQEDYITQVSVKYVL